MVKKFVFIPGFLALTAVTFIGLAVAAEQVPNLSGTYKCGPDKKACQWSGMTFTVTQKGNALEAKNEKNEMGTGTVTSSAESIPSSRCARKSATTSAGEFARTSTASPLLLE